MDERTFIYRIDAANRIVSVNREWLDFAQENEAPELTAEYVLGQPLERFIAGWEVRHLYEIVYARVRGSGREITFPFNCDSPALRRSFTMRIVPLADQGLEFNIDVRQIVALSPRPLLERRIERAPAVVVICSWCRRFRREDGGWAAVEAAANDGSLFGPIPPSLSHGICPDCGAAIRRQLDEPRQD